MIRIMIQKGHRQKIYVCDCGQTINEICGFDEVQIVVKEKIKIRVAKSLTLTQVTNTHFKVTHQETLDNLDIYFFKLEKEFYEKYCILNDEITVGNHPDNTVYYQNENISAKHLKIDLKTKEIVCENEPYAYEEDVRLYRQFKESVCVLECHLIITKHFIMVCKNSCIQVKLPIYNEDTDNILLKQDKTIVQPRFRSMPQFIFPKFHIHNVFLKEIENIPLFYTLGPSLSMMLMTVTVAFINAFLQYQKGKFLIELLPLLLVPCVMLLSAMLWPFLQRKFVMKKQTNTNWQIVDNFKEKINDIKEEVKNANTYFYHFISENYYLPHQITSKHLLWQKKKHHHDFLKISLGTFNAGNHCEIQYDEIYAKEVEKIVKAFQVSINQYENQHFIVDLKEVQHLGIVFNHYDERKYAYYLLLQLLIYYSYHDIQIAFICSESTLYQYASLIAIEHFKLKNVSLIATNLKSVQEVNTLLKEVTICFVLDTTYISYLDLSSCYSIICLDEKEELPAMLKAYIHMQGYRGVYYHEDGKQTCLSCLNLYELDIQKSLNNIKNSLLIDDVNNTQSLNCTFFDIMPLDYHQLMKYYQNPYQNSLSIILGKDEAGNPLYFDMHEAKDGPHGIIAGTTGSGKSELLLSLCMGLCCNYHTDIVQLLIIDFKGGELYNRLKGVPHIVGKLSNMSDYEIDKCLISLEIECQRRQKNFERMMAIKKCTNIHIDTYLQLYEDGMGLEKFGHLVIVVDEFAELKRQYPHAMSQLISLSRIGRSLGIHLILATQKPSGIIDDQIQANCHFKICLKVQTLLEAKEVIQTEAPYYLSEPGSFYIKTPNRCLKGYSAYCNAPYPYHEPLMIVKDVTHHCIGTYQLKKETTTTQLTHMINEIQKCNLPLKKALWETNVLNQPYDKMTDEIFIGTGDYYQQAKHVPIYLKYSLNMIYGGNLKSKQMMFESILRGHILQKEVTSIYIIDDMHLVDSTYLLYDRVIQIIKSDDTFYLKQLINKMMHTSESAPMTIICTHFASFKQAVEKIKESFYQFLELLSYQSVRLYVFTQVSTEVTYKESLLFKEKIALHPIDSYEISSIYNMKNAISLSNENQFVIKYQDYLLLCYRYMFKLDSIKEVQTGEKVTKPFLKQQYQLCDIQTQALCIGMSSTHTQLIYLEQPLWIAGYVKECKEHFLKNRKQFDIQEKDIFQYQFNIYEHYYQPILWIGPGLLKQHVIPHNLNEDLKVNEGYYYYQGKGEHIILIND